MLKLRIITAIVLLPLVIFGVLYASPPMFAIGVGMIIGIAGWEWSALASIKNAVLRMIYTLCILLCCYILYLAPFRDDLTMTAVYFVAGLWFLLAIFLLFDPVRHLSDLGATTYLLLSLVIGSIVLLTTWIAFVKLHSLPRGPGLILGLFVLIWAADTGAYLTGSKWGKRKLSPHVSPGKTWEGVFGGVCLALAFAVITPYILELPDVDSYAYLLIAIVTVVISIFGDLFISTFKRVQGLKDSGHILPGHGGILDRIDSMISASPIFLSGLLLCGNVL